MATIAERGANAGTAQRARDGRRPYPANRHRVCIGTRSCVRRLTILVPIGAAFGHGTRTHTLSRTLAGREASKCAVRPQSQRDGRHLGPKAGATISPDAVHPTEAPAASARAARGRADGPPRSTRVRLVAERGPCDVRARARGAHVGTRARPRRGRARWAWRRGGDGSCAGTARVMRAAAHACMRACTGVPTKRSTRRARAHPCVLPGAVGDDAQPRSVLCHKGLRRCR